MRNLSILPNISSYRVIAAIVGLAILFGFSAAAQTMAADNTPQAGEHLITIHDRGAEKGVLTKATTIRKALDEAHIALDAHDLVEPGLDEQLVANSYQVNIYRARPILIHDGSSVQKVLSAYQTPKQIAEHAGIAMHDEDEATLSLGSDIVSHGASLQLDIDRATGFTLVLYGKKIQAYSQETTVAAMMKAKGIHLGKSDSVSVAGAKPLVSGMKVEIWRDGVQTITKEENIAFPIEQIQDADREVGYRDIKTPGEKGKKTVTYEIVMKNGKEKSRKKIQSVTTKVAKKQVEVVGTKVSFSGSTDSWLSKLRSCESGGNYKTNTGNGYYGAYQFSQATWNSLGTGYAFAHLAPPSVQDKMIIINTNRSGSGLASQNPGCMRSRGLSAFPPQ